MVVVRDMPSAVCGSNDMDTDTPPCVPEPEDGCVCVCVNERHDDRAMRWEIRDTDTTFTSRRDGRWGMEGSR